MNHGEAAAILEQFLDGALPARERWAVIAHLDDCLACRRQAAFEARLRGRLREQLTTTEPAPGLASRLRAALAEEAEKAPRPLIVARPAPAVVFGPLVAALLLLALVAGPLAPVRPDERRTLAATHALFAQDDSLLDVTGDAETVSTWFRDEVGLDFAAPALEGYEIIGGRLIVLNGAPVAQLVYESEPDEVYLSLLRFQGGAGPAALSVAREGTISIVTWPDAGGRVALIGAAPEAELRRLAASLAGWPSPMAPSRS